MEFIKSLSFQNWECKAFAFLQIIQIFLEKVSVAQSFTVISNHRSSIPISIGDIVYKCTKSDHGVARHDSRISGIKFISVTLSESGNYPFFTIAIEDIQEV